MQRRLVAGILVTAMTLALGVRAAHGQEITVTLLGTGNPVPAMNRFGPSTLVEVGTHRFLFDAGRGALQRLTQLKVRWADIDGVFLTHLHSDHVVGFPDLWLTGWLVAPGRDRALPVWGPEGTASLLANLTTAFAFDIGVRQADDRASPEGVRLVGHEVHEGIVYQQDGVTITAFDVDHAPVAPALGYRIDYGGRSVVLSGDTRVSENLIRHATGVDLLVHEVVSPESMRRSGRNPERVQSVIDHHTTAEQAGMVFAKVKPRLAVYSHIGQPDATPDELLLATRKAYAGPVEVGEDLMVIVVGSRIEVRRPPQLKP